MSGMVQGVLLTLTVGVIFVNGWTDAPNAIASAVCTGALDYRRAVGLAAVCNLLGIVVMSLVSTSVADTMLSIARLDRFDSEQAAAALCAAMAAIVLFAGAAWIFGIPTSESHALIAALTGAVLALGGRAADIDPAPWGKVLWGLGISLVLGGLLGYLFSRLLTPLLRRMGPAALDRMQRLSAALMAFFHGAQDGQKFMAVLIAVDLLVQGRPHGGSVDIGGHWPTVALCACAMALGTGAGGKRIIETVGGKMTALQKPQGVCADLAGGLCLLIASLTGIPMSTTHTKTTALLGAGLGESRESVDFSVFRGIVLAWLITFPACGLAGYGMTRLFLRLLF